MSVRLRDERVFACEADAMVELWKDPVFQRARSAHLGTSRCEFSCDGDVVVLVETRETYRPHAYVTRLETRWAGRYASWELRRVEGPGDARAWGRFEVRELMGGRCAISLEGRLEIQAGLFGPMIERLVGPALRLEKAKEARFVRAWISTISST